MRFRRRTLTRLKLLLAVLVLAALAGGVILVMLDPSIAIAVGGVGLAIAIAGHVLHRDAVMTFMSALLYPILAVGIYALHAVLGLPVEYLVWVSCAVFGLVVVVLTADEVPQ